MQQAGHDLTLQRNENELIMNRIYQEIFREDLINPNGCSIKGTFFVSHKYTNYSAVQVSLICNYHGGDSLLVRKPEKPNE